MDQVKSKMNFENDKKMKCTTYLKDIQLLLQTTIK